MAQPTTTAPAPGGASNQKRIAVVGATGHQGCAVVHALLGVPEFKVIAITRDVNSDESKALMRLAPDRLTLRAADLNKPETLEKAFEGCFGAFLLTMYWDPSITNEYQCGVNLVHAAKRANVQHVVWSTLPNTENESGGKLKVAPFTSKARVDQLITESGFKYHTFVSPSFYWQNIGGLLPPRRQDDGTFTWQLPMPNNTMVEMVDINDIGPVVAGAFRKPESFGAGARLYVTGMRMTFEDLAHHLSTATGKRITVAPISIEEWKKMNTFRHAEELGQMLQWIAQYGYYGRHSHVQSFIDAARTINKPKDLGMFLKTEDGKRVLNSFTAPSPAGAAAPAPACPTTVPMAFVK